MPQVQVKKVVAVCFLEAVKLALDQIGAKRLEQSQTDIHKGSEFPRVYGEIRRLRDYLQRCASGYQDLVDLDLAASDAGLLVACCRAAVDHTELRLSERSMPGDERNWLQKKLTIFSDWAVELADKPLVDLPLPRVRRQPGEAMRMLTVKLQQKVFGDVTQRMKIVPPGFAGAVPPASMATGVPNVADAAPASAPAAAPIAPPAAAAQPVAAPDTPAPGLRVPLFHHETLREPRLRALVGMDLAAFERCVAAGDLRLATIMIAAILEAAILDHVIPRRTEFNLSGTPDTWNPVELLLAALGDRATPKDRSLAYHLFAARGLLRPAVQMVTPTVVTPESFERLQEFVQRALHGLGFGAQTQTLPPGTLKVEDLRAAHASDPVS